MELRGVTFDLWFTDAGNKAPAIPSVFGNNFALEDYLLGQKKLRPFSSTLGAKTPFLQKNGGCTMGKTEKRAIVGEGCAENDKR